jgi:Fe2+ transport system protein FeoA
MPQDLRLSDAAIGATFKVVGYAPTARDYKRKLLAMGLTPGTEFTVKRHAPLGDPTEIEVRSFRLSLRKVEADALIIGAIDANAKAEATTQPSTIADTGNIEPVNEAKPIAITTEDTTS